MPMHGWASQQRRAAGSPCKSRRRHYTARQHARSASGSANRGGKPTVSAMDGKRLDPSVFQLDPRMRDGRYTDRYFLNASRILSMLASEGYRFHGQCPPPGEAGLDASAVHTGDVEVEMQCFTKRKPFSIACGVDNALAILKSCAGFFDVDGRFHNTASALEVHAVHDGATLAPGVPALRIRGRYRDFAALETPVLGVLARQTRVATNTYEILQAAGGKPVFFFSARYDMPETQCADGYAYKIGVERHNLDAGTELPAMVTTEAQGEWWGGKGGGTVSHSYVLSFLGDCVEAMLHFARILPAEVKRVALVDTANDCVGTSVAVATSMFRKHHELKHAGRTDEAEKYVLFGVRCDTAVEVRDVSVEPLGDPALDCGVVPRLIWGVRRALDGLYATADLPQEVRAEARRYFEGVRIVASGGFDPERIREFERQAVPVDVYGVGSAFLTGGSNDFTADVVRVRIGGRWVAMAKFGRRAVDNPDCDPVPVG